MPPPMSAPPGTAPPPMYGPTAMPPMGPPMGPPMKPKTMKPTIAGIPGAEGLAAIIVVCGAIGIIFGLIALIGGVMALQRKKWSLALIGSILGLFTIGFVVFEASILSLVALILLAISKNEF